MNTFNYYSLKLLKPKPGKIFCVSEISRIIINNLPIYVVAFKALDNVAIINNRNSHVYAAAKGGKLERHYSLS